MAGELRDLTLSGVWLLSGVVLRLDASNLAMRFDTEPFLFVLSWRSLSAELKLMVGLAVSLGWGEEGPGFTFCSVSLLSRGSLPTGQ